MKKTIQLDLSLKVSQCLNPDNELNFQIIGNSIYGEVSNGRLQLLKKVF